MLGFDYTERIDPAALKAAGCEVVFRYLSVPGYAKNITLAEAEELLNAGIAIVLNYETTATFMLSGYNGGVTAARSARAQARALLAPATTRIYYSADFDVTTEQVPTVLSFLSGAVSADAKGEVGDYGGLRMVLAAGAAGYPEWQTVAWSGGQWARNVAAQQTGEQRTVGGVVVDVNNIVDFNALGAWTRTSGEVDMQLSDQVSFPPAAVAAFPDYGFTQAATVQDVLAWTAARVSHIANHMAAPVDPNAIAEAVVAHISTGGSVDVPAIAEAVAKLFGSKLTS